MNNSEVYIYTLASPEDGLVRYVGQTNNPKSRLSAHISDARTRPRGSHRSAWVKSLLNKGIKPVMEVIAESTEESANQLEVDFIKLFRACGARLVNMTVGGEGSPYLNGKHNHGHKISLALKGKKRPNGSIAMKGKIFTEVHRKNIGIATRKRIEREGLLAQVLSQPNRKVIQSIEVSTGIVLTHPSLKATARDLKISCSSISRVLQKKTSQIKGYTFQFAA